jgi:carboxymethylenebutenolidase
VIDHSRGEIFTLSEVIVMDEMKSYLVHEFLDEYRAQRMDRRAMLRRITLILGSAATASAWFQSQGEPVSVAEAAESYNYLIPTPPMWGSTTVPEDDPSLASAGMVNFSGRDGAALSGYAAKPANLTAAPAVLVIHANRALTDHYRDVARRFAREGYMALAIDLVSREGGAHSFADPAAITAALSSAGTQRHLDDLSTGIDYLLSQPEAVQSGVGVTGYCFGGNLAWRMAVEDDRVVAAVPYYGSAPPLDRVPSMRAAVFGVYASDDERVNQSAIALEDALRSNGKTYAMKQYPGTYHGFFDDTNPRYPAEQARQAWADTLAWFQQHLAMA